MSPDNTAEIYTTSNWWGSELYLFLYNTSQGRTVNTAALQPALTCSHRCPLDRDVDLLNHWDNKILSHREADVSLLMCRNSIEKTIYFHFLEPQPWFKGWLHLRPRLWITLSNNNVSAQRSHLDLDSRIQQDTSHSCPGLVWAGSSLEGRLSAWHCPEANGKLILLGFISGEKHASSSLMAEQNHRSTGRRQSSPTKETSITQCTCHNGIKTRLRRKTQRHHIQYSTALTDNSLRTNP